jgi:hypothetical protein
VARDNFSARYDLDRIKGTFSRPAHKLYGRSYVGEVLVLVTAKGGVASAWMLHEMAARGMAPKAIVFDRTNTILAQGPPSPTWRWSTGSSAAAPPNSSAPATGSRSSRRRAG